MYAVAQGYGMLAGGLANKALIVGGDVLSKIMDWSDRSTAGAVRRRRGAVVLERVADGGFLGFELGADGSAARSSTCPQAARGRPRAPSRSRSGCTSCR
jgi:3-oxoacyl-[acyl-carrier-protein] synthase-3